MLSVLPILLRLPGRFNPLLTDFSGVASGLPEFLAIDSDFLHELVEGD